MTLYSLKKPKYISSRFMKLTVFALFLLSSSQSFSQQKSLVLIPYETDTLVGITEEQFETILFSFSYIRGIESDNKILDSSVINLESRIANRDSIIQARELQIIEYGNMQDLYIERLERGRKARKKEKVKSTLTYIGLGLLAGVEAGVIGYLLIK